jgi:uncharacterized protein YcaQ
MKNAVTPSEISAFRLKRHHLAGPKPANLAAICQNVCGIQAQVMSAAEMAIWARGHHLTRSDIKSALLKNRALVKTSAMRQTLHLLKTSDFSLYISALKRSRLAALRQIMSRFGITSKEAEAMTETIIAALGNGPKTQPELIEQIMPRAGKKLKAYIKASWSIQIFRAALVEGLICYGPERNHQATFVLIEQWLPKQKDVSEAEAKQTLLRRYLSAYGPATPRDFSRWSGISMAEAKPVWKSLQEDLREVHIGDQKNFILRQDYEELAHSTLHDHVLCLLPGFDPYLLGHAEKDHFLDMRHYKRVYRAAGWITPVVMLNGKIIGVWSHTRKAHCAVLQMELFAELSPRIHAKIEAEAAALARFWNTAGEIEIVK